MRIVKFTIVAAFLAAVAMAAGGEYVARFEQFKTDYKRDYASPSEEAKRLGFFIRNMQRAEQLQALNPHARFGANEFADMSEEEFKVRHNAEGHYRAAVKSRKHRVQSTFKATGKFAQAQDWRNAGVVTAVKNQGQCGSCWSFSTTGNIEGQWAKSGNGLVSLSEQELVSCDTTCNGCNGGLMDDAFEWLVSAMGGGITSESQYPYVSGGGYVPACQSGSVSPVAYISGYNDIPHSEEYMAEWLSTGGPVSIGVDATSWQTYQGGVMTNCQSSQVDHGVLAVGYDLASNPPFWIIKNSWGPSWGENGYIRVEFGQNQCLITTAPSSSVAGSAATAKKVTIEEPPVKVHRN
jgi:cysteine peptidase B